MAIFRAYAKVLEADDPAMRIYEAGLRTCPGQPGQALADVLRRTGGVYETTTPLVPQLRDDIREVAELTSDPELRAIADLTEVPVPLGHLRGLDPQTRIVIRAELRYEAGEGARVSRAMEHRQAIATIMPDGTVIAGDGRLRALADGEEVAGDAGDRRVVLHRRQRAEDELALGGVAQPVPDTGRPVQRALDRQQVVQAQPGIRDLAGDAGRVVEVGRGEQPGLGAGVAVLAGVQVVGHQRAEPGLVEEAVEEPVQGAGVPGDDRGGDDAARAGDAAGLGEGTHPVGALSQVVERAEQQDRVVTAVVFGEAAGIAGGDREPAVGLRLLQVQRHRVDQVHLVAAVGEPGRVDPAPAADVQDARGRGGQEPFQQHLGPQQLKRRRVRQPAVLLAFGVMSENLSVDLHLETLTRTLLPAHLDFAWPGGFA